ncbi:hypothetical protein [Prescottella subtropica]|uniref:hypothetical protein n=1 Tax=Prescottella subtropica TaxID=2545757 RepID=UPI0010F8AB9A|nr:hypothetical protein [Prescottella subtropica]
MTRRIAGVLAAAAVTVSLGLVTAPAASAQTVPPGMGSTEGPGSVGLCLVIPVGSLVLPLCI